MRAISRMLLAGAAGTALLVGTAAPAAATDPVSTASGSGFAILFAGHVDVFDVEYEDGELELHIHDEEGDRELDPESTLLVVNPQAKTTVPNDQEYAFLGQPGVDQVWILPDFPDPDLLFAGWSAEHIDDGVFVDDEITIHLHNVVGLGAFALYTVDVLGSPVVHFHSGGGAPDTLALEAGHHGHPNWAFTKPGPYLITVEATGVLADTQEEVSSGPVNYVFLVRPF